MEIVRSGGRRIIVESDFDKPIPTLALANLVPLS
jgi:hypothetical protein